MTDWYSKLNTEGIEALRIVSAMTGFDQPWLEHIVMEQLSTGNPCGCELGYERELQAECSKWVAVKRYKEAQKLVERAQTELKAAEKSLESLT